MEHAGAFSVIIMDVLPSPVNTDCETTKYYEHKVTLFWCALAHQEK
jgi:hypothetical protein